MKDFAVHFLFFFKFYLSKNFLIQLLFIKNSNINRYSKKVPAQLNYSFLLVLARKRCSKVGGFFSSGFSSETLSKMDVSLPICSW